MEEGDSPQATPTQSQQEAEPQPSKNVAPTIPPLVVDGAKKKKKTKGRKNRHLRLQRQQQQQQPVTFRDCCSCAPGCLRTMGCAVATLACVLLLIAQRLLVAPLQGGSLRVSSSRRGGKRGGRGGPPIGTPLKDARWKAELEKKGGLAPCAVLENLDFEAMKQEGRLNVPPRPALRWTHIPKTGQSFAYTIIKHGCPLVNLAKMHQLVNDQRDKELRNGMQDPSLNSFMQRVLMRRGCQDRGGSEGLCPHLHLPLKGHNPIKPQHFGQTVTMLREPHQRLISAAHMGTGCQKHFRSLNFTDCLAFKFKTERGCYTRFLNGELCSLDMVNDARCRGGTLDGCVVSATKVLLNGGIRFAGITEWWDASICLFHAISGGKPENAQFKNIHPGRGAGEKRQGLYDTSILGRLVDTHDLFIYEKAKERFREQWEQHRDKMPIHPVCQELARQPTPGSPPAADAM